MQIQINSAEIPSLKLLVASNDRAPNEEAYKVASQGLKAHIVERELTKDGTERRATADNNIADTIHQMAVACPDENGSQKLFDVEKQYKSANTAVKDAILLQLTNSVLQKVALKAAMVGLTSLPVLGKSALNEFDKVTANDAG